MMSCVAASSDSFGRQCAVGFLKNTGPGVFSELNLDLLYADERIIISMLRLADWDSDSDGFIS
jgi:hypothetical protein